MKSNPNIFTRVAGDAWSFVGNIILCTLGVVILLYALGIGTYGWLCVLGFRNKLKPGALAVPFLGVFTFFGIFIVATVEAGTSGVIRKENTEAFWTFFTWYSLLPLPVVAVQIALDESRAQKKRAWRKAKRKAKPAQVQPSYDINDPWGLKSL